MDADRPHERARFMARQSRGLQEALLGRGPHPEIEDLGAPLLRHFDRLSWEKVFLRNTVVRSGMLFFANTLRGFIVEEEQTWREQGLEARVHDYGLPENPEPVLFMSVGTILGILKTLQAGWYERDMTEAVGLLHWLLRRIALLVTFPYDDATFDVKGYRQRHDGAFLANMDLLLSLIHI